jgi:hypothetical protein
MNRKINISVLCNGWFEAFVVTACREVFLGHQMCRHGDRVLCFHHQGFVWWVTWPHIIFVPTAYVVSCPIRDCWGNWAEWSVVYCPNSPYRKSKSILCGYKYNVQSRHINPCSWRQRYPQKCCILCSHRNTQDCLLENISFWFATCCKFCCRVYEIKLNSGCAV